MFDQTFKFGKNRYDIEPRVASILGLRPTDVASAVWLKRSNVRSALSGEIPAEFSDAETDVCEFDDEYMPCSYLEELMSQVLVPP